ncbi:TrmB family transcriptional regulator [Halolamina sp.]|uniref:TrmB family transcriptional regulator n=1 Tax=Halolamina sp. TaxID=1940283 RepID=UPI0035679460
MSDADATEALTDLGLSTYGARTFVGLQKLGISTASEVAQVADVPRSQVYGAMEELEDLGLVDVQAGSPKRYRPVDVEEARTLLYERLKDEAETAFDYLDSVRGERAGEEGREAIWTTEGGENITARVTSLVANAESELLYATSDRSLVEGPVADAFEAAAERGVTVTVASADERVREAAMDAGFRTVTVDAADNPEVGVGRVLVVDGDTVLLSVLPSSEIGDASTESAFWSDGTGFATILAGLVRERF